MKSRSVVLGIICLLSFILISGCTWPVGQSNNTETIAPADNVSQVTATPTATPSLAPVLGPEPDPIIVSHEGSDLVKIHLEKGLAVFTLNHNANGACQVWLSDKIKKLDLLYDINGGYWGSKAETIPAEDDYYLEVQGNDLWTVQVTQPRYNYAQSAPLTLSGSKQVVSEFFSLNAGPATFHITHDGWMNFNVWLFRNDGTKVQRLASTYGIDDETTSVNITASGVYVLDVQADGNWKVDVSQ